MVEIKKLIWDEWNTGHIAGHDVNVEEVEEALKDEDLRTKQAHSGRIMALGRSGERLIAIILSEENDGEFYVVTARDMDKRERRIYAKEV